MEVPAWMDDRFARIETVTENQYVGMTEQEARLTANRNGIRQIRSIHLPLDGSVPADAAPHRLNLLLADGRVLRAGFF
jgi:hypothetical protein